MVLKELQKNFRKIQITYNWKWQKLTNQSSRKRKFGLMEIMTMKQKKQVRNLIENNPGELIESFYQDLEFGTGGLRGIMGWELTGWINTRLGWQHKGLANYIKKMFAGEKNIKVAIAYDSRNNSRYFAQITAEVFSANE